MSPLLDDSGSVRARKLSLPGVMLCAVASVNILATVAALRRAMTVANFGDCVLFTDSTHEIEAPGIRVVTIEPIVSSAAYSQFVLRDLVDHVTLQHCMLVQWDGYPTHPKLWEDAFLECDYIGAPWPQFSDGHNVGNGGFSLRSRNLMEACRAPGMTIGHPEDVMIGRVNRSALEKRGLRFAETTLAARFSCERSGNLHMTFGFHGVFHMVDVLGVHQFLKLYESLDERTSVWRDLTTIIRELRAGGASWTIGPRMWCDRIRAYWPGKNTLMQRRD